MVLLHNDTCILAWRWWWWLSKRVVKAIYTCRSKHQILLCLVLETTLYTDYLLYDSTQQFLTHTGSRRQSPSWEPVETVNITRELLIANYIIIGAHWSIRRCECHSKAWNHSLTMTCFFYNRSAHMMTVWKGAVITNNYSNSGHVSCHFMHKKQSCQGSMFRKPDIILV